jgi:hypothetical protein
VVAELEAVDLGVAVLVEAALVAAAWVAVAQVVEREAGAVLVAASRVADA